MQNVGNFFLSREIFFKERKKEADREKRCIKSFVVDEVIDGPNSMIFFFEIDLLKKITRIRSCSLAENFGGVKQVLPRCKYRKEERIDREIGRL